VRTLIISALTLLVGWQEGHPTCKIGHLLVSLTVTHMMLC